jgi:hydroxymethylpyrimidine kinase/phosphomethylpyrimidine kinase
MKKRYRCRAPKYGMNILAIGGSDPSSGAGVQSDIRAASALGAHCFGVITAITSQNSSKFFGVESVSAKTVQMQIDSILSDFTVDAIIIGMVYDSKTIQAVHSAFKGVGAPIVIDPVIQSTTGGTLLKKSALADYKRKMVHLASVITPNVGEAEVLSGSKITDLESIRDAAKKITDLGAKSVVITGCEFEKGKIVDYVYEDRTGHLLAGDKVDWQTHGSGCNFSAALAYYLGQKKSVVDAAKFAKSFAFEAIRSAQSLGRGVRITSPRKDKMIQELAFAIQRFQGMRNASYLIPEVQTNFVYAKPKAISVNDVIGVAGRIVRTKETVVVAGSLEYGGSRHVATAVITMQKKFPGVRSALNIRYDARTVEKFQGAGYNVSSYDRRKEPMKAKDVENSSISWGIQSAIRNSDIAPDIVYHRGDVGKEPMIIIFGSSPKNVLAKLTVLDSKLV